MPSQLLSGDQDDLATKAPDLHHVAVLTDEDAVSSDTDVLREPRMMDEVAVPEGAAHPGVTEFAEGGAELWPGPGADRKREEAP